MAKSRNRKKRKRRNPNNRSSQNKHSAPKIEKLDLDDFLASGARLYDEEGNDVTEFILNSAQLDLPQEKARIFNWCGLKVTRDIIPADATPMPEDINIGEYQNLLRNAVKSPHKYIPKLEAYVDEYPDYPVLQNHLLGIYANTQYYSQQELITFAESAFYLEPDYIFNRSIYAQLLSQNGEYDKFLEIMGDDLDITYVYEPKRGYYLIGEVTGYYTTVVLYLLNRLELDEAANLIKDLLLLDPNNKQIKDLQMRLEKVRYSATKFTEMLNEKEQLDQYDDTYRMHKALEDQEEYEDDEEYDEDDEEYDEDDEDELIYLKRVDRDYEEVFQYNGLTISSLNTYTLYYDEYVNGISDIDSIYIFDILDNSPGNVATKKQIPKLEQIVERYPENPMVNMMLLQAYLSHNQKEDFKHLNELNFKLNGSFDVQTHCHYTDMLLQEGKLEEFEKLMDAPKFDLQKLFPDKEIFSQQEVQSFYNIVLSYHLSKKDFKNLVTYSNHIVKINPHSQSAIEAQRLVEITQISWKGCIIPIVLFLAFAGLIIYGIVSLIRWIF